MDNLIPIWKNTYYTETLENGGSIEYSITIPINIEGEETIIETIFNGKAWANPNTNEVSININNLVKDYLEFELPNLNDVGDFLNVTHPNVIKTFYFIRNGVEVEQYRFIKDWSYKTHNRNVLSAPINGKGVDGQLYFVTYVTDEDEEDLVFTNIQKSPNNLYSNNLCNCRYVLYYLNRYSGMDSLAIEAKVVKTDNYQPYFITSTYNNNTTEFGKKIYHNDITTTYNLTTGWLKDSESENLAFNLLSSNLVYLHDIKENKIMPVVITNSSVEYKTFKNQNNKLYNYTISVECSQKEYRL